MNRKSLLMIPGPIEFEPAVLAAVGAQSPSHVSAEFINAFGEVLENLGHLFLSPSAQPFVLSGSGTLAMDFAASNLVESGDNALVISTGYFGDRFCEILRRYGANVTQLKVAPGEHPLLEEVEAQLKRKKFKLATMTHVDTSTGVLVDVKQLARLCRDYQVLTVVDGVCSIAAEEFEMESWGIDVAFTASQKAVGVPPGLALIMVSEQAMQAFQSRKTPVSNYYCDYGNWLPVMAAYEARKPAYFGTPAVNLVSGLNVSLNQILAEGIQPRIARHKYISEACKQAITALGLEQIPQNKAFAAHSMTAPRYPKNIAPSAFLPSVLRQGVVLAGGLLPPVQAEYFRIGHMGSVTFGDILAVIGSVEIALAENGYEFEAGKGIAAANSVFQSYQKLKYGR